MCYNIVILCKFLAWFQETRTIQGHTLVVTCLLLSLGVTTSTRMVAGAGGFGDENGKKEEMSGREKRADGFLIFQIEFIPFSSFRIEILFLHIFYRDYNCFTNTTLKMNFRANT